jgi:hypothetical protein
MNTLGPQPCEEAAGGLHHFASTGLKIRDVAGYDSLGVLLAHGLEVDAGGLLQRVFNGVLREGTIAIDGAPFGQVEVKDVQRMDIGHRAGREKQLDRLALGGDQEEDLQAVEIAPLGCGVAPVARFPVELRAADANVIAHGYGEAVDEVDGVGVEGLESLSEHPGTGRAAGLGGHAGGG